MADDDQNPWDSFWEQRAPGLWKRPAEQAFDRKADVILNRPFISNVWDPRPDLQSRIEDQRGLTLPELDLQAKFQKARWLGPWDLNQPPPLDPAAPHGAMDRDLGSESIEPAARRIAAAHAGDILSMHAPNTGRPDLPAKKVVKKKEVK